MQRKPSGYNNSYCWQITHWTSNSH